MSNYPEIISALDEVRLEVENNHGIEFDGEEIATANGIYSIISTQKFLFLAMVFKELLELIKPANSLLQSREVGYRTAVPVIDSLIEDMKNFRKDAVFERIFSTVVETRDQLDLVEPEKRGRPPMDPKVSLKTIFHQCIDVVIKEMSARFTEHNDILTAASLVSELNFESLKPLSRIIELPEEYEVRTAKSFIDRQKESSESDNQSTLKIISSAQSAFPNVFKMLQGVEAIGCSTAVNEASFSSLSRVDNINRTSMSNERLRNLSFLAFESKELKCIDRMVILRLFDGAKN